MLTEVQAQSHQVSQYNLVHLLVLVDAVAMKDPHLNPAAVFTQSDRLVAQLVNNKLVF